MSDLSIRATAALHPSTRLQPLQPVTQRAAGEAGRPATSTPAVRDGFSQQAQRGPLPAVSLDLLTYNTWGLPAPIGKRNAERMEQIGLAVQGHGIVALQETFSRQAGVVGQLAGHPYQHREDKGGLLKLNPGLTTLSKYPILEKEFVPFQKGAHADQFARKGVLFTRLLVPGVGPVDVYNTHYQAEDGAKYTRIRLHDNEVLAGLVAKHHQGHPTFVMGDFNSRTHSPEYQDLMRRLPGLRDLYVEQNPGDPGYTSRADNTNNKSTNGNSRLDYIFYLPGNKVDLAIESMTVAMTQTFNGKHASDHYAVHGRVQLTPKTQPLFERTQRLPALAR